MHDSMPYDPIQGQSQDTGPLKLQKLHFSRSVSSATYSGSCQMITDSYTVEQYLNLIGLDFYILRES